jgi:hypothetical protein
MTTMNAVRTEVSDPVARARNLLNEGRPEDAMETLTRTGQRGRDATNIRGVCLLRLGRHEEAVKLFRSMVFPDGAFTIPESVPASPRVNYVTALLLDGNVTVALSLLDQLDRQHPEAIRLLGAVRDWKKRIGLIRRVLLVVGIIPSAPVTIDRPGQA